MFKTGLGWILLERVSSQRTSQLFTGYGVHWKTFLDSAHNFQVADIKEDESRTNYWITRLKHNHEEYFIHVQGVFILTDNHL